MQLCNGFCRTRWRAALQAEEFLQNNLWFGGAQKMRCQRTIGIAIFRYITMATKSLQSAHSSTIAIYTSCVCFVAQARESMGVWKKKKTSNSPSSFSSRKRLWRATVFGICILISSGAEPQKAHPRPHGRFIYTNQHEKENKRKCAPQASFFHTHPFAFQIGVIFSPVFLFFLSLISCKLCVILL